MVRARATLEKGSRLVRVFGTELFPAFFKVRPGAHVPELLALTIVTSASNSRLLQQQPQWIPLAVRDIDMYSVDFTRLTLISVTPSNLLDSLQSVLSLGWTRPCKHLVYVVLLFVAHSRTWSLAVLALILNIPVRASSCNHEGCFPGATAPASADQSYDYLSYTRCCFQLPVYLSPRVFTT